MGVVRKNYWAAAAVGTFQQLGSFSGLALRHNGRSIRLRVICLCHERYFNEYFEGDFGRFGGLGV